MPKFSHPNLMHQIKFVMTSCNRKSDRRGGLTGPQKIREGGLVINFPAIFSLAGPPKGPAKGKKRIGK